MVRYMRKHIKTCQLTLIFHVSGGKVGGSREGAKRKAAESWWYSETSGRGWEEGESSILKAKLIS